MADRREKTKRFAHVFWLLLLVAIALVWFFYRPQSDSHLAVPSTQGVVEDVDEDDVLVDLKDDLSDEDVARFGREHGYTLSPISSQSEDERLYRIHVPAGTVFEVAAKLMKSPDVEVAEPDGLVSLGPTAGVAIEGEDQWAGFPNDPKYRYQWHLEQIHMPAAWKLSDGKGVVVAVLDTGVAYENYERFHQVEDLAGIEFVKPYDFVGNTSHANDDHGHGTHVAGTIAQATHNGLGVAGIGRKVQIMPLKVLSGSGSGSVGGIADAIRYAADEGAQVINMSLGSRFPSKILGNAVTYAHKKGVTVVCAAGNDGRGKVGYPAAYPGAIAVAATQFDESTTFYSNWGKEIDLAAPGGNTRVDQNGDGQPDGVLQNTIVMADPTKSDYFAYMGTSMASPHVAGLAALVVAEGVTRPDAVEQILKDTARRPAKQDYQQGRYGAGIIDADAAIKAARGKTGVFQLLLGLLVTLATMGSLRARSIPVAKVGGHFATGLVLGASGLFVLPALGFGLEAAYGAEALTRGLPAWGLSWFGPAGANLFFMSALIPAALLVLSWGMPRARMLCAGLALGVAGHLLFLAAAGLIDIKWMVFDSAWLAGNAALCATLARQALKR